MALIALRDVTLGYRGPLVLDGANLTIDPGERICLLGRNGSGKTSLLRVIQGEIELDRGEVARQQGLITAMLPQEVPQGLGIRESITVESRKGTVPLSSNENRDSPPLIQSPILGGGGRTGTGSEPLAANRDGSLPGEAPAPGPYGGTVFDEVTRGLGPRADLLAEYHHTAHRLAAEGSDELQTRLDRLHHALELDGGWGMHQAVDAVISRMTLDPDAEVAVLSAGMKRRVLLAKALVGNPDILLLDEPTNHLDINSIRWLEEFLLRYAGSILFVTHDRALLRKLATRILELDRGRLTSWTCDYETYLKRKEAALETEARQFAEFDKKLAKEEVWIRTGIQARRTRNEGRVRALEALREIRRDRRQQLGEVRMEIQEAERSGRLVIEAKRLSFSYSERAIVADLSTTIMRGDRVGVIGPNGSGKTTLLRLLLGELQPTAGAIRHGTNLEVAYFDQLHAQLDDAKSVRANVRDGSDWVTINGRRRHIIGYLDDFLFTSEQASGPVARLSGGERNRLLLARLFTTPSNVLVMDEPTNDLDMETLELLEDLLIEYPGTLLLVSHDREFLNNVVTSTLVLEGEGRVKEYAGGYDDWLRQRLPEPTAAVQPVERPKPAPPAKQRARRLTYKEQRELETLPGRIETLEADLGQLHQVMADPACYRQAPAEIVKLKTRLQLLEKDIAEAYGRWEQLEAVRGQAD
jgi:ABC transport system ATP-binding/permease protein